MPCIEMLAGRLALIVCMNEFRKPTFENRTTVAESSDPPASPSPMLRCVIVEDQSMFLDLLAGMMAIQGGIRVVAEAHDVEEGIAACAKHCPDVLVLDLALPDGDGLEVARHLIAANPAGRVIVFSGHASDFICPPWLDGHLHAVISKNDAFESLRREIDTLTGRVAVQPQAVSLRSLTPREAEIFGLIGEGLTSAGIAERLGLSRQTVQTHRKRIAAKLKTSGNDLVCRAVSQRAAFFAADPD